MENDVKNDMQIMENMKDSYGFVDYNLTKSQMGHLVDMIHMREQFIKTPILTQTDTEDSLDRNSAPLRKSCQPARDRDQKVNSRVN